jgi:HEPN domain-containing protein
MSGPDPADVWAKVLEWPRVADRDQRAAQICLAAAPPLNDVAAYHCQQAMEKILKGFLVHACIDFGKTHDLDALGGTMLARFPAAEPLVTPARGWSDWSVIYRYPDETGPVAEPSAEEIGGAIDLIARLAATLRSLGPPVISP